MSSMALVPAQWRLLAERMALWTGLHFAPGRERELRQGVVAACAELAGGDASGGAVSSGPGADGEPADGDVARFAARLLATPAGQAPPAAMLTALAAHLTIGETYFFRDPRTMDALAQEVLPALVAQRRGRRQVLRLWSAGCCTGEEAYSLAILLHRFPNETPPWEVEITGTDINPRFLDKARAAVYGDWSFRGDPYKLRGTWFRPAPGGKHALLEGVRRMVRFSADNLAVGNATAGPGGAGAGSMDLIVCRNVLMYLSPPAMDRAVARFHAALAPGGWLVVSPSEVSDARFPGFEAVTVRGARFYRKPVAVRLPEEHQPAPRAAHAPAPAAVAARRTQASHDHTNADAGKHASADAPAPVADGVQARALADAGRLPDAERACARWAARQPLDPAAHYLHAVVLLELQQAGRAREALDRAVYLDGDFVMAHLALGRLALGEGSMAAAARHFANARALLERLPRRQAVPESDGLDAGRLLDMLAALLQPETAR